MKSPHVLFPSISHLKKQSTLNSDHRLWTSFAPFLLKKIKKPAAERRAFRKRNRKANARHRRLRKFENGIETSKRFFRERQWLVKACVYWGYLESRVQLRGGPCTWIFRGFHPLRTAPIGFSVRPMLFNRSARAGNRVASLYNKY